MVILKKQAKKKKKIVFTPLILNGLLYVNQYVELSNSQNHYFNYTTK